VHLQFMPPLLACAFGYRALRKEASQEIGIRRCPWDRGTWLITAVTGSTAR
jgi:hypothetical protein